MPSSADASGASAGSPARPGELSDRTRRGLSVLAAGAAIGVLGDALLRAVPWGLNVSLCVTALVAAAALLVRRHRIAVGPDAPWLGLTALLLAVAYLRRASGWLGFFDLVALMLVLAMALRSVHGVRIAALGFTHHLRALAETARHAVTGGLALVFCDLAWREILGDGRLGRVRAVALGLALAAPVLAVFGALFASADAVFAAVLNNTVAVEPATAFGHVALWSACGGLAAGYLRGLVGPASGARGGPVLGAVPVCTALALVNLLFLLFVVVQLRYLFGGQEVVLATTGLTLAEYARSGFFELVTVSGLTLPLLLVAEWALRGEGATGRRMFRQLAGITLGLLLIVMASAFERMRLYVAEFGLSEIRLYATAFMVYLLGLFGWLAWTALRGYRRRFAFGAVLQGFAVLAGLHLLNPDAVVAGVNVDRAARGHRFDGWYLSTTLSADAVPLLLERMPDLEPRHRCRVAEGLLNRWTGAVEGDWRSWNWSRARARRLVHDREIELRSLVASAPCTSPNPR